MKLPAVDGFRQAGLAVVVAAGGGVVAAGGVLLILLAQLGEAVGLRAAALIAGVALLAFVFNRWDGVGWVARRYRWWGPVLVVGVVLPAVPAGWLWTAVAFGVAVAVGAGVGVAVAAARGRGVGRIDRAPREARPSTLPEVPPDVLARVAGWTANRWLAWRIHRGWAQRCREMGLDAGRRGADDRMVVPRLLPLSRGGVRVDDLTISVAFKPREDWEASDYAAVAERLLGSFSGHSIRYEPFTPRVLGGRYLRFFIGRRPLPTRVPPPEVRPSGGRGWLLGDAAGGGQVRLHLSDTAPVHGLCIGGTGGGKTVSLRGIAMQARADGWRVVVIDTKGTAAVSDYMDLRDQGVVDLVIHDIDAACRFLIALDDVRADLGLDAVAGEAPPLLVICDEVRDYIGVHPGEHLDLRKAASAKVTSLAVKGRSARIHLILAIQRSDVAELGQSGGFMRAQLMATWAVGDLDDPGYGMAFGNGKVTATDKLLMNGKPGRGLAHKLNPWMGTDVVPFQGVHWPGAAGAEELRERLRAERAGGAAQRFADLLQSPDRDDDDGDDRSPVLEVPRPALRVLPAPDGVGAPRPVQVPVDDVDAGDVVDGGEVGGADSVPDDPAVDPPAVARRGRYQRTLPLEDVLGVLAGDDREWRRAEVAAALGRSSGDGSVGRRLDDGVKAGLIVVTGPRHARRYRAVPDAAEGAASPGG